MKRVEWFFLTLFCAQAALVAVAQDVARQPDAVMWDDFEEDRISWTADRAATNLGLVGGEGVNGSFGWGIYLNADSEGFWAARLQTTFEAPENSFETAWRVQFAVKADTAPTAVSARMAMSEDPYTSTEEVMPNLEIPAGSENRMFYFDFLIPVSPFLDTPEILFLFGIIGTLDTEVILDDIYVYPWNTVAMLTFESADPTAVAEAVGGALEQETENPKEGVYSAKLAVTDGGGALESAGLTALWTPYPEPHPRPAMGNYRISVQAKSNVAPLRVQAGILDQTAGIRSLSPTEQTVTAKDTWQTLSFLVKLPSNDAEQYGFFFNTGGQGTHTIAYDLVIVQPTDEEITDVDSWPLY